MDARIKKIAQHYGLNSQNIKLIEECGELITAVAQNRGRYEIIDELADVQIMIEQIMYLMDAEAETYERINFKLKRQLERIRKEKEQCD